MTEELVVKVLNILQTGTEVEKDLIRMMFPEIHRALIPTDADNMQSAKKYFMSLMDNKINFNTTIITPIMIDGKYYEFRTTFHESKLY